MVKRWLWFFKAIYWWFFTNNSNISSFSSIALQFTWFVPFFMLFMGITDFRFWEWWLTTCRIYQKSRHWILSFNLFYKISWASLCRWMPQASYWPLAATKLKITCLKIPVKCYPRKKNSKAHLQRYAVLFWSCKINSSCRNILYWLNRQ